MTNFGIIKWALRNSVLIAVVPPSFQIDHWEVRSYVLDADLLHLEKSLFLQLSAKDLFLLLLVFWFF